MKWISCCILALFVFFLLPTAGYADTETPPAGAAAPAQSQTVQQPFDHVQALIALGYYTEEISKNRTFNTRNAIVHFQAENNLKVDGIYGEKTASLLEYRASGGQLVPFDKVAAAPTKGRWIVINKTKRIITLYEGNKVLKKIPVAVGKAGTPTIEGKFKIQRKAVNPRWGGGGYAKPVAGGAPNNPLGTRWMGFYGGYGMHGTTAPGSIGTDASHGCVRMITPDAEMLYDLVSVGTPVWVGKEDKLRAWGVIQGESTIPAPTPGALPPETTTANPTTPAPETEAPPPAIQSPILVKTAVLPDISLNLQIINLIMF